MTSIQAWAEIIDNDWTTHNDFGTPKPTVLEEKEDSTSHTRGNDICRVNDGGPQSREPGGLDFTERDITTRLTVELRTAESRERMFGERTSPTTSEDSGLVATVLRIFESYRKGHAEWDLVDAYEVNDVSGNVGMNRWQATVEVRLETFAQQI